MIGQPTPRHEIERINAQAKGISDQMLDKAMCDAAYGHVMIMLSRWDMKRTRQFYEGIICELDVV
jgi:hypothetical protein